MSKFYAVKQGRKLGVFTTWDEAEKQVKGYPGAKYKSFKTRAEANEYIQDIIPTNLSQKDIVSIRNKSDTSSNHKSDTQHNNTQKKSVEKIYETVRDTFAGFINNITSSNKNDNDKDNTNHINKQTVYTDGSCVDKLGGYGFVIVRKNDEAFNSLASCQEDCIPFAGKVHIYPCTNQIAELYAILKALEYCKEDNKEEIEIFTDSQYCIGCLTEWYPNWEKNGWKNVKGESVANKALIQEILRTMKFFSKVKFTHVRAHNGDMYNEMCDRLANEGRQMI